MSKHYQTTPTRRTSLVGTKGHQARPKQGTLSEIKSATNGGCLSITMAVGRHTPLRKKTAKQWVYNRTFGARLEFTGGFSFLWPDDCKQWKNEDLSLVFTNHQDLSEVDFGRPTHTRAEILPGRISEGGQHCPDRSFWLGVRIKARKESQGGMRKGGGRTLVSG